MLARRSMLVLIGGGLVAASTALTAQAAPVGATVDRSDVPNSVADLRRNLAQPSAAEGPKEMQYYIVRRRYWVRRTWVRRTWVRRYWVRPRRIAWRCWSNGYSRTCRWRTI